MDSRLQIVLDTNVLVAGLRSRAGASHEVLMMLLDDVYAMHLSLPVMLQYEDLLARQAEDLYVTPEEATIFQKTVVLHSVIHEIYFLWRHILPDGNDAAFLELAVAANADYIVTHNIRHFRGSEAFGIQAITPIQLLQLLGDRS
jgi:putative PIN family toxin of toxin-antitoxin system